MALALAAMLVLSGCGGTSNGGSGTEGESGDQESAKNEIKDLVIPRQASRELETFNVLYAQRQEDNENLTSLVDGLLEVDQKGQLVPCIAEEWGTEDNGLTWTFKLREGVKWVDVNAQEKADCTAQDFATGLEWVLNFHKNDSSNISMPVEMTPSFGSREKPPSHVPCPQPAQAVRSGMYPASVSIRSSSTALIRSGC